MTNATNQRKIQHLHIIDNDDGVDRQKHHFDNIYLTHRALPELDLDEVNPSVTFMGKTLSFPLLISSMTGGDHELVRTINKNLALAAESTGIALGVGSQRVMFSTPDARTSFQLRPYAPNTLLFSNLGAVQLNYGFDEKTCLEAIETVGADALCLHLNPLQEAVQPEGDTRFSGLAERLGEVASKLDYPIVLKEVGAGLSQEDVRRALKQGLRYFDVAGTGGTSWSRIEHHRQPEEDHDDIGLTFQDWGIPTPLALIALKPFRDQLHLIASGGIRTGVDMVKAIVLGSSLCGMASPFLKPAMKSADEVIALIQRLKKEFVTALFLLGVRNLRELKGNESYLL